MGRADEIEERIAVVARRLAVSLNDAHNTDLQHLARHRALHAKTRWRLEHLRHFLDRLDEPEPIEELELSLAETLVDALERLIGVRPALERGLALQRPSRPSARVA